MAAVADGDRTRIPARWAARAAFTLLIAGIAAGILARVYGAWAVRYVKVPDAAVAALMSRHVAQGVPWPVFFYGQAYMGSLEPLTGAVFARIFGPTGFAINLGTALCGALSLLVIVRIGRSAGGRAGALVALGGVLLGPFTFFMFQFVPRGGYMMMLVLGCLVLWLAARAGWRLWTRQAVPATHFLLIGLLAGAAWWTTQLVTSLLAAAALMLALGLRGRVWARGVWLGLAGFLAGSLPFWCWNAANGWASFGLGQGLQGRELAAAAVKVWTRYERLHDLQYLPRPAAVALEVLYLVPAAAGAALALAAAARRRLGDEAVWHALAALAAGAAAVGLLAGSSFATMNTGRYLVPLVPAVSVLAAYAAGECVRRRRPTLAALIGLLAAVQLAAQAHVLVFLRGEARAIPALRARDARLLALLEREGVDALYSPFHHYGANFNLGERVAVTDFRGDRYPPYGRAAERSDRTGVLGDFGKVSQFLAVGGGTAAVAQIDDYRVHYSLMPPADAWRELPREAIRAVRDASGRDAAGPLLDRDTDTEWRGAAQPAGPEWLEIAFAEPVTVRGLRLTGCSPDAWPRAMRVLVQDGDGNAWREVLREHAVTDFYWSGPRAYWGGRRHRLEYRLPDVAARAVRIVATAAPRTAGTPWTLGELQVFGPGDEPCDERASLPGLLELVASRGLRAVYADRWLSNTLHDRLGARVAVELEPRFFPGAGLAAGGRIDWRPDMALVVRHHDAPATRAALAAHGVAMQATAAGAWTVFDFAPGAWRPELARQGPPLAWTGYACWAGRSRSWAFERLARAVAAQRRGDAAAALHEADAAGAVYPAALTAAPELLGWLAERSPDTRVAALRRTAAERGTPPVAAPVAFAEGMRLEGVGLSATNAAPGGAFDVTYYWRCPEPAARGRWVAFVHFRDGRSVFQDDHAPLASLREEDADGGLAAREVFRETRRVTVPADTPPGTYALTLGLYRAGSGLRAAPQTALPTHRRAVTLPVTVTVRRSAARL